MNDWISIQEAARYARVSERTIRRWIALGSIVASRVGPRLIRVRFDSLEHLFAETR
jgi:excisionase family DNA binding protein